MTNREKYKTEEEQETAFFEFCGNEFCDRCCHSECFLFSAGEDGLLHCYDSWLDSEAGELRSRLNNSLAELSKELYRICMHTTKNNGLYAIATAQRIIEVLSQVSKGHWNDVCDGDSAYFCDASKRKVQCAIIRKCRKIAEEGAKDGNTL